MKNSVGLVHVVRAIGVALAFMNGMEETMDDKKRDSNRAAEAVNPTEEESYWRQSYQSRPYFKTGRDFEHYSPAYRYGWESASRADYHGRRFEDVENDLFRNWSRARGNSRTEWSDVREATRDAFERVQKRTSAGMTSASETARDAGQTTAKKTDATFGR